MTWNSGPMLSDGDAVSGIARMNIAAMDGESLAALRKFFAVMADHGTEGGRKRAPGYLAVIDEELTRRDPHAGHDTCPSCSRCRDCGSQHKTDCEQR